MNRPRQLEIVVLTMILVGMSLGAFADQQPGPAPADLKLVPTPQEEPGGRGVSSSIPVAKAPEFVQTAPRMEVNVLELMTSEELLGSSPFNSHVQGQFEFTQIDSPEGEKGPTDTRGLETSDPVEEQRASGDTVFEFAGLSATGWIPPDTIHTVGPSHVIEAVNSGFSIYSKLGDQKQGYTTFSTFFNSLKPAGWTGFMFDPRVIWSNEYSKYVMLILGKDSANSTTHFFFAISQSTDPLGDWWIWRVDRTNTNGDTDAWLDYATIDADQWGIYVTGNMFYWTGGFKYSMLQIINPDAFTGGATWGWVWTTQLTWPTGGNAFSLQPAHPHSANGDSETFFVNSFSGWGTKALLWRMGGTRDFSTFPTLSRVEITGMTQYNSLGEAIDQPDTAADIDGGNARFWNAIYDDRRVFATLTNDVDDNGSRSAAHTISIDTNNETLDWENVLTPTVGGYYYYPAVTTHAGMSGPDVAVFYSYSSATTYASGGVAVYNDVPASGGRSVNKIIETGLASYEARDTIGRNRWGDYSGAAYDWTCQHAFGAVEYAGTGNSWRTRIAAIAMGSNSDCKIIDMRYPETGETLLAGNTYTVTWAKANLVTANDLYVLFDGDQAGGWDSTAAANISSTSTSTSWTVPNFATTTGRMFVGQWSGAAWTTSDWGDDTFVVDGCSADVYESNNSSGAATVISHGSALANTICVTTDVDWFRFSLTEPSAVTLMTSGPSGDTRMWLYESSGTTQIEYDDDDGSGAFSFIDRICDVDELPAGTYFVKIDEFGNNDHIDSYTMSLNTSACTTSLIFSDGFESGSTSPWSSSVP